MASKPQSLAAYRTAAKREFAAYGFTSCPLTDDELKACRKAGVAAYSVGCDVAAGFAFSEALEALERHNAGMADLAARWSAADAKGA